MTKLEDLIFSLVTVIVRYHDTQVKPPNKLVSEIEPTVFRKKSREHAIKILSNAGPKFDEPLNTLIADCTKGYPDRKHFLSFILHEIIFLKVQLNKKEPFKSGEIEEFQQQVNQLLIDFQKLLLTQKDKLYKVTYSALGSDSQTRVDLAGLINNAYLGNHFCNSGLLILDEVLGRFHITEETTEEEIREIAISLCSEHQNSLSVTSLQTKLAESEKEAAQMSQNVSELTRTLQNTQSQLKVTESQFGEFKKAKILESLETDTLRKQLEENQAKLKAAEIQIEDLKKQKDPVSSLTNIRKHPFYPSLFGSPSVNSIQQHNRLQTQTTHTSSTISSTPTQDESEFYYD